MYSVGKYEEKWFSYNYQGNKIWHKFECLGTCYAHGRPLGQVFGFWTQPGSAKVDENI